MLELDFFVYEYGHTFYISVKSNLSIYNVEELDLLKLNTVCIRIRDQPIPFSATSAIMFILQFIILFAIPHAMPNY
jgi:hypothetical protein